VEAFPEETAPMSSEPAMLREGTSASGETAPARQPGHQGEKLGGSVAVLTTNRHSSITSNPMS